MAQIDIIQRFLDAGADLGEMTQRNADRLVRSLVDAGDVQMSEAQRLVKDLVDQGRRNRERLVGMVEREVQQQIARMGLATQADLRRLERKVDAAGSGKSPAKQKKSPAKKKKSPAKRAASKKTAGKKASKS